MKPESEVPSLQLDEESKKSDSEPVQKRNMNVQTVYRESSAQTSPWQPDPQIMGDGSAEVLKLDFLKWGKTRKIIFTFYINAEVLFYTYNMHLEIKTQSL